MIRRDDAGGRRSFWGRVDVEVGDERGRGVERK